VEKSEKTKPSNSRKGEEEKSRVRESSKNRDKAKDKMREQEGRRLSGVIWGGKFSMGYWWEKGFTVIVSVATFYKKECRADEEGKKGASIGEKSCRGKGRPIMEG